MKKPTFRLAFEILCFFRIFLFAGFGAKFPTDKTANHDLFSQLHNLLIDQVLDGHTAITDVGLIQKNCFFFCISSRNLRRSLE